MIPVSQELNQALSNYAKGNFGLWFNKFIDLDDSPGKYFAKPSGRENSTELILKQYLKIVPNSNEIFHYLQKIHKSQEDLMRHFKSNYIPVVFRAQLVSRLITGLGQTHPTETGMVLDHNLGIPYIPAASVKGLVKASRRLNLDLSDETRDDDESTLLPNIFGGQQRIGRVIFMDAYPEQIPDLDLDIMTPHFGDYYKEGSHEWPGDWLTPNPIKFLTVAKDTVFIFRALVDKDEDTKKNGELVKAVKEAYQTALTVEGVGAKTAVGYGRFKILTNTQSTAVETKDGTADTEKETFNYYDVPDGSKEYYLKRLAITNLENQSEKVSWLFQKWELDSKWNKDKDIARAFLPLVPQYKKKGNKETHFYKYLKGILNS